MRAKTDKEIYKSTDRPRSTLTSLVYIFGLVVDKNREYVVVESGPLRYSPQRGVGRRADTNLLDSKAAQGGFRQGGREKQTDLCVILTGGGGFAAGGRGFAAVGGGCLGGLPHDRGKAGDTFSSEKTGLNLSTETLSCLEPICSLK